MSRRATPVLLLALALGAMPQSAVAAGEEPIRIGFLGPLTGIFASGGRDMQEGLRLGLEQSGFRMGGRKVELIEEDDEGSPPVALTKYRKLVTQDRIHALVGVQHSSIGYALAPLIEHDRLPALYLAAPDDLTKRRPAKWILRTTFSASQLMHPLGDYAYTALGYRKIAAVAMDAAFGYEQIGGFQRVFEELGGKVTQKLWTPVTTLDYAAYITQLRRDVDAVLVVFPAGPAVRFVRQYQEYGLKDRVPLLASGIVTDEVALRQMGDEALGIVSSLNWSPVLSSPVNELFVRAVESKYGKRPGTFHLAMYSAARWIAEAARLVDGNVEDRERFLTALRRASESLEDPRGPLKLDAYNNPTQNVYILKLERVGGRLQNTVVHTYPMVSQFWRYTPEEFLKAPPYTRDHPATNP